VSKIIVLPDNWQKPAVGVFLVTLACIGIFWETWASIVAIWLRSETYTHGFLVAPMSLWLIWIRKNSYRALKPATSFLGLFFLAVFGFIWLAADLVHVLVVAQWAVVGLLICAYWTLLGDMVMLNMLFPMLFLFLMVPFGEDFVPPLMEYTASFVVGMLRLTGISVYREGLHFTLTSGQWSVVDACSGIRYLIASVTLGAVYMYLNYSSYKKRILFMLVCVIVPIVANGFRGYMIVMIGHLSDMQLATGIDHLVYGWLFFGIVMLLVFYIGSFWQDPPQTFKVILTRSNSEIKANSSHPNLWIMLSAAILCFVIWPVSSGWMSGRQGIHADIPAHFLQSNNTKWEAVSDPDWGWEPHFRGVVAKANYFLSNGGNPVGIYMVNFGDESQGELINSQNLLAKQKNDAWRIVETSRTPLVLQEGKPVMVDETVMTNQDTNLLVWRWYRIGAKSTANSYYAKFLQLLKRLSGDTSAELLIVLYTETPPGDYQAARARIQKTVDF